MTGILSAHVLRGLRLSVAVCLVAMAPADGRAAGPSRSAVPGPQTGAPARPQLASRVSRLVPALMEGAFVPGVQMAILQDGAVAWLRIRELPATFGLLVRAARDAQLPRALEQYRAARARTPADALGEGMLNQLGYDLLYGKDVKGAIALFQQNVDDHPDSWNAHDSLGEAYAADGQIEPAIKAYERSLELNPSSAGGAAALKKLRERRAP